jgi:NodT family efflux transporter outer membrane factor (OMF) lipoprotein
MQVAQSDVLLSNGVLKPRVDATITNALRRYGLYTMDGAGNSSTFILPGKIVPTNLPDYFIGFQSSWEADIWGKLKNRKRAAISRYLATKEGRNLVITNLVSEIAQAYFELQAADQTIRIIEETIAIQQRAFDIVKIKKEAAVLNQLAVKQFEAQLINLKALHTDVLQQIVETENRINFLVGRYPQKINRDTLYYKNDLPLTLHTGIPSALLENRPDIRQAGLQLIAAKADLAAAKAAFYPSLNITAGLGYQAFRPNLLFTTPESVAFALVGNMAAPLVNRAAFKAAFYTANAQQREAMYQFNKTLVNAFREVQTEIIRTKNLQQIYDLKVNETNSLTESVGIAEELFRTGRATYLEVLFAQQQTLKAKLELMETKKRQLLSAVHLYKALGGGWR